MLNRKSWLWLCLLMLGVLLVASGCARKESDEGGATVTSPLAPGTVIISGAVYETIYGSVKIAPAGGVAVTYTLGSNTYHTTTEPDGSFKFQDVPEGKGKVEIEKEGYTKNETEVDTSTQTEVSVSRSITKRNPNKGGIQSAITTTLNTFDNPALPKAQVTIPDGAVDEDTEAELTPFITATDLPGKLPDGAIPIAGANLEGKGKNFNTGKEAFCYIILPSTVRAETLSTADIRLMEYINGQWVIDLTGKGKYYDAGPWAGYLGPSDTDTPARLKGCHPWCYIHLTTVSKYAFISGLVKDDSDNPLKGILVMGGGCTAVTDKLGQYRLGPLTVISGDTLGSRGTHPKAGKP